MNAEINEYIRNSVETAIRNSFYFQQEGVRFFEIVAMDLIDDGYNFIDGFVPGETFKMLVLVKHEETENLSNHTAFTVIANPDRWTMDAMYDGSASIHNGEIWANTVCFGALTIEKSTAWIERIICGSRYVIRDREGGNLLDDFVTLEEAHRRLEEYVAEDEAEGTYTPRFYEIYDRQKEEAVEVA